MKLKTTLLGKTYSFRSVKDVLAKANEEKTGDQLAGLAAETAQERVAAKVVLSEMTLQELRDTEVDMFSTVFIGNSQTKNINGKMVTPRGYLYE